MPQGISRRYLLLSLFFGGCSWTGRHLRNQQFVIGTVSYESGEDDLNRYDDFQKYLAEKLNIFVQVEPTFNEVKALERIQAQAWSLVLAPPGLAALAMSRYQYTPLLPLQGVSALKSVVVVPATSPYQDLRSLVGRRLAIGQFGSATGYYLPIFNLYGLTLAELLVSPTPKAVLETIAQGKADAGAMSMEQFNAYKSQINQMAFRVLFVDPHPVPPGLLLLGPSVDRNLEAALRKVLNEAPSVIANDAGFVPTGTVPDYTYMISVVNRVQSIFPADATDIGAKLLSQKPVRLFADHPPATASP
jgi:phosphonate transport system substrate-binding protein